MTTAENSAAASTADALIINRSFDAPRERIWRAWTEAKHLAAWWGPENSSMPVCNMDVRVGGLMHYYLRVTDEMTMWGRGIYKEVEPNARFVVTDSFSDEAGNIVDPAQYGMSAAWPRETLIAVTLEERDGKTQLTLQHDVHESVPEREHMVKGWNDSLDRLANYLKTM